MGVALRSKPSATPLNGPPAPIGWFRSQTLRKLGMNWAVVADSETCTSECMSDQLATLGRNRETDQLAPLGRNREMSACQTNWHHCGRNREMSACQTNCHHWDATGR